MHEQTHTDAVCIQTPFAHKLLCVLTRSSKPPAPVASSMFSLPRAAASAAPRVRPPDHAALPVAPYYIRSPPSTLDVSRETRYLSALRERNAESLLALSSVLVGIEYKQTCERSRDAVQVTWRSSPSSMSLCAAPGWVGGEIPRGLFQFLEVILVRKGCP